MTMPSVGKVSSMPGTSGFTMAVFKAEDVPVGTELYTAPHPEDVERLVGSSAFEKQALVKREIQTDRSMSRCPACQAANVLLAHSVSNLDARRHVECRICDMRGPIHTSDARAVGAWNSLPR